MSDKSDKKNILLSGAYGLVGSAVRRLLDKYPEYNFSYTYNGSKYIIDGYHCDLTKECEVKRLFEKTKPHYVIHLAAKVGGIGGNLSGPADYYRQNILMNTHMIDYSYRNGVEKFIGCSSICAMPDNLAVFSEEHLHDGRPYIANEAYGYAKRMLDTQIRAYRNQYGSLNYMSLIPGNIAGPNDNYNMEGGHVLPSLIHKIYLAKRDNTDFVVWGDGSNLRQFVSSDDLAYVIMELLRRDCSMPERLLVCGEKQNSIREIVDILVKVSGFKGNVVYDTSKPGGQLARMSDISLFKRLFPNYKFKPIENIVKESWEWFNTHYEEARK